MFADWTSCVTTWCLSTVLTPTRWRGILKRNCWRKKESNRWDYKWMWVDYVHTLDIFTHTYTHTHTHSIYIYIERETDRQTDRHMVIWKLISELLQIFSNNISDAYTASNNILSVLNIISQKRSVTPTTAWTYNLMNHTARNIYTL